MASDTSKSKTEYLKRYLESEKKTNRRKRPKPSNALVSRIKIVDKNIDLKSIKFGDIQEDEDDEAPAVAEIIDERPVEVKLKEVYESSRWKKLGSAGECNQSNTIFDDGERNSESKTRLSIDKKTKQPMPETNYHGSDSDCSPPCSRARTLNNSSKARHDSDSDCSPLRSHTTSIQTKRRHDSDSDISPPRRTENLNGAKDGRTSMKLNKRKNSSSYRTEETSNSKRFDSDSDLSPERARSKKESFSEKILKQPRSSDSDLSPPRKHDSVRSVENTHNKDKMKRPMKTLSGLKAGLQNARTLKEETQALREREKLQINKLNAELSGRNAETIVRDRKTGKKRDLEEENREKEEKEKRISEQQQKYSEWGKGIEQAENQRNNLSEALHEMSKPLARHCDDEELEDILKSRMRDGDPMFQHMKKKKQRENASLLPEYSGPAPPPNRFGLKPGYRWDGVDRSNGFEKKYFDKISSTKALQEEAYLWSVADM